MTTHTDMMVDADSKAISILAKPSFTEVDFFEILDVVSADKREYKYLSQRSQHIDEFIGMYAVDDRIRRKAAADIVLGFTKHGLHLLEAYTGRLSMIMKARAFQMLDRHTSAIQHYKNAMAMTANPTIAEQTYLAYSLALNGDLENAEKTVDRLGKECADLPMVRIVRALIVEFSGDYEKALDLYDDIIDNFPQCKDAIFRLAVLLDNRGTDPERVEDLYSALTDGDVFHIGAAINQGLFYVDHDKFEHAENMFNKVLRYDPDNQKVWLFIRDTQSSNNMMYDEGLHKEDEKLRQILRLPISEFELSVRSRNCLSRMNVHTLGDLIAKSETELLAYKNFGETSLKEIKEILARKGLRLGMAREEVERKMRSPSQRLAALAVTDNILDQPMAALNLSIRSLRCLEQLDIDSVRDLTRYTERSLLASKNFGLTSLTEVKKKLTAFGLSLASDEL